MKTYTVLSLGAGVQSSVVLLMSCKGVLPKPDMAIFCDTQWEPKAVYSHLWWLAEQATEAGIPLIVASKGNIKEDALRSMVPRTIEQGSRAASMPLYTKMADSDQEGMIRRQCTKEYKIDVVERTIRRDLLGLTKGERTPKDVHVNQWIGISVDEKRRMRVNDKRWLTNVYPLIGWPEQFLERPWTRGKCQEWFADNYPGRTLPRSACIGCPMHSNDEWRNMRDNQPEEYQEAVEFDHAIRHRDIMRNQMFLHRSCLPLDQVDLSEKIDPKQENLFACIGMCGV